MGAIPQRDSIIDQFLAKHYIAIVRGSDTNFTINEDKKFEVSKGLALSNSHMKFVQLKYLQDRL